MTKFDVSQEVYITLTTMDATANEISLLLKSQSKTSYRYGVIKVLYSPISQKIQVWSYSDNQGWKQHGNDLAVPFPNGDQFGARALSDGTIHIFRNGDLVGTQAILNWPYTNSGGYIGLWVGNFPSVFLDDFGGGSLAFQSTSTPSATASKTITPTGTSTPQPSFTSTSSPSSTPTPEPSSTLTSTASLTFTPTSTSSPEPSSTATSTASLTLTPTDIPIPQPTFTPTTTATPTFTPTDIPTPEPSLTPTPTASLTLSPTDTHTPQPTFTFTSTETSTDTPTGTPSPEPTFTATLTASWTFTLTQEPSSTATATFIPTETLTPAPSFTPSLTASLTCTSTDTPTPEPSPTPLPTATPTFTSTSSPTLAASATPLALPYTPILDNFNRSNGAIGSNWAGATGGYRISSNRLDVNAGGDIYWTKASFAADQEAYITLLSIDNAATEMDILLKVQGANWTYGLIEIIYHPAGKNIQVWTYDTVHGWIQHGGSIPVTFVNGDRLIARAWANGTVEIYRNTNLLGSRDITSWPYYANGGFIGLWFINSGNAYLDDFGGGSLPAKPPTQTPTSTFTSTFTSTPMPSPTLTATLEGTLDLTLTPTLTPEGTPSVEPSLTVTSTNAPEFTNTPSASPTITSTPTPTAIPPIYLPVGPGGCDVIPHQIVRAQDDRLYLFSIQQYSPLIHAFRTRNPGLPNTADEFTLLATTTEAGYPMSLDAVYDGSRIIHVLINTYSSGLIKDYPFDTQEGIFKSPILIATNGHPLSGDYLGTSGVSGMVSSDGNLHIAYWSKDKQILYQSFGYNIFTNTLTPTCESFRVDSAGQANHPVLAVSPLDQSLTIAWVSEATANAEILVRTMAGGSWSSIEKVSTSPVWHSQYFGINIDQGPSLVIDASGRRYLAYIEHWDSTGSYGRVHFVTHSGAGWSDQALPFYSHDPAVALNSRDELYLIGHGHPRNATCSNENDMCVSKRREDGSWNGPQLFAQHTASLSFDSSPSVKWSVVGWNRPETIEFLFFGVNQGNYSDVTLYYGRLP